MTADETRARDHQENTMNDRKPMVQTALELHVSPRSIDKALLREIVDAMDGWPDDTRVHFDLSRAMDQRERDIMHIRAVKAVSR